MVYYYHIANIFYSLFFLRSVLLLNECQCRGTTDILTPTPTNEDFRFPPTHAISEVPPPPPVGVTARLVLRMNKKKVGVLH